jgi:hypothetical protein
MVYVRGTQGVAVDGLPVYEELRVKTVVATHTIPGRLVIRETDDNHFTLAGDNALNVLGYYAPTPSYDSDTVPVTEDWCRIGHGPGVVVPLTAITGMTIVKGDKLAPAATGMVKSAGTTPDFNKVVGIAEESVTTGTLASAPILVRMLI